MDLSCLIPLSGAEKKKKRVGRGKGSGHGKTSCRGHKGQGARAGGGTRPGFEGGQMPLQRRVPKRGFHNPFKKRFALINISQLEHFEQRSEVSPEILRGRGFIKEKKVLLKVLGEGSLSKALTVEAHYFTPKAKGKIESAGGQIKLLSYA